MIDLHDLRENPDKYIQACQKKQIKLDIHAFLELDKKYRELKTALEELRSRQNAFSKEIAKFKGSEKEQKLAEMKVISESMKDQEAKFRELEIDWSAKQLLIPSIPLDIVPIGKDDSDNKEIKKWGEIQTPAFKQRDHVEIGKLLDILDIERGVKVSGSRSYFLKGDGAKLQHALLNYAIDFISKRDFLLIDPPHIVRYEAMMGTGYFPGGEESAYHLDTRDDNMYLIGTSEVPVAAYHMDEILEEKDLPKRYAGHSPCYRREAGTYGKDTQGIYRVHQFYKIEQVVICKNDFSESALFHAELLKNAEDLVQSLNIPYRVVICSTGDMGQGQVYKNDIESWMPSRNNYGETHSCSTFHEFQSRRLNLRYKGADGKNRYCHTLNNTLLATTRFIIAILENYQQKDGSVVIPKPLRSFMGGQEIIEPR